jgi:hypothetical protein
MAKQKQDLFRKGSKKSDPPILDIMGLTDTNFEIGVCGGCYMVKRLAHESHDTGRFYCSEYCRVRKECPTC